MSNHQIITKDNVECTPKDQNIQKANTWLHQLQLLPKFNLLAYSKFAK